MSIIFNIIFWVQNFFFQEVYYEPSLFRKRKQNSLVFVVWLKVSYGLSARNSDATSCPYLKWYEILNAQLKTE